MGKLWVAGNSHTRTAAWKRIFPPSLSSWLLFLYPLLWQRLLEHLQMQATVQQRAQLCPRAQGGVLPWRLLWVYRRPVPHRCDRPCTQAPWPQAVLIRELATCPGKHSRKLNEHDLGDIIKIQLNSYLRLTSKYIQLGELRRGVPSTGWETGYPLTPWFTNTTWITNGLSSVLLVLISQDAFKVSLPLWPMVGAPTCC